MIYEIDYIFCAISAFIFKNFLTFALFIFISYIVMRYVISKLSNITIILYSMFVLSLFTGSIVLLLLPSSVDKLGNVVVNSYYLGIVAFILYVALLISMISDLIKLYKTKEKKKQIKEKKEESKEKINIIIKNDKPKDKEVKKKVVKKTVKKPVKKKNNKTK